MSDTPPSLPPSGWYADPSGAHASRWWDGAGWTDHVRPEPPADDPPPLPAHLESSLPLGASGRPRGMTLVAVAALVVGLVATVVVGLRNGATTDTATGPGAEASGGPGGAPLGQVAPGTTVPDPIDPDEVVRRWDEAGCTTVVDGDPLEDRTHLDPAEAPPPAALYPDRPPHSGRHYGQLLRLPEGTEPVDERAVLHNMEHGSVVVWFDPDAEQVAREVAAWRDQSAELGFTSPDGGAVFASPMPEGLDDPPTVALRAWGVAVDCERFDPVVADAFLAEHWGSHGDAPEAGLSPYPDDSLRLADPA